jgi:hypothetical protein
MKELIFRHLTASRKNLRFGLILSLGLFVFTFLIYLSAVCGNLKAMGIAESEVFPHLIMTFISLTALVPMMTGLVGQSMKKDSDSGFDRFMLASPVSVEKDVLSLYLFVIIMTGGFILLSEAYVGLFVAMGVLPADISCFVLILIVGAADVIYTAMQIPAGYSKTNPGPFMAVTMFVIGAISLGISLVIPDISSDPVTVFRGMVAAAPVLWTIMPVVAYAGLFAVSFLISTEFRKGRVYNS